MNLDGIFFAAWMVLAERGMCDEIDGAEYRRVYAKWKEKGCPAGEDLIPFIVGWANTPAGTTFKPFADGGPPATSAG